jgi:hypothetical protein
MAVMVVLVAVVVQEILEAQAHQDKVTMVALEYL